MWKLLKVDNVNIPVKVQKEGNYKINIFDLSGRVLYSETVTLGAQAQTLSISTADLAHGSYILSIQNNGETHSMKLIR